jgi:hypothetical protein
MGRLATMDMLNQTSEDKALRWHLTGNFFPPIDPDFIEPAQKAINMVKEDKGDDSITMPNGITRTAWQIIEGLRLEDFLNNEEE